MYVYFADHEIKCTEVRLEGAIDLPVGKVASTWAHSRKKKKKPGRSSGSNRKGVGMAIVLQEKKPLPA